LARLKKSMLNITLTLPNPDFLVRMREKRQPVVSQLKPKNIATGHWAMLKLSAIKEGEGTRVERREERSQVFVKEKDEV